jgi:hypothetical protein
MQTEISTNYQFVSPSSQANLSNKPSDATGGSELPQIAVGAAAIADCLGLGELECAEPGMSQYVDGRIDSYQEATIRRHDQALAALPNMASEASARGENTVIIDCRAYYRNFAYPQLNYPSPYEVLRVAEAIETQGFTAVLEPVNPGRGKYEENSHSALYELKACFTRAGSN